MCSAAPTLGTATCLALVRTDIRARTETAFAGSAPTGYGYGPADLVSAYDLPRGNAGKGRVVAVIDAYNDPDAISDLATYRAAWGLPPCDTKTGDGCLTVDNEEGATSPLPADDGNSGWDVEESLDVDMVAAICPLCKIHLMEADDDDFNDLGATVNAAVKVVKARYVSNSYAGQDYTYDHYYDATYYNHRGIVITAASGDDGYIYEGAYGSTGVGYPAASRFVVAVGGTSLTPAANARGWTETVWGDGKPGEGTGSGCSQYEGKPKWQHDSGCSMRTDNDVAAVADPDTGVAVYDTYNGAGGWQEVGGTSASSPIIAAVYALAGKPASTGYPAEYPYVDGNGSNLNDITSGSTGTCTPAYLCTGEVGYDGPTGLGTPSGVSAFVAP